ncbi:type II toxin-antitoxin system prevent-host-death family antitoxin [Kineococcus sp. T13]|uniref:type II toxin-antitoxin system prevent-host-death family antitoxin n=1 Tax=Kineococcus vitellinus TaxID=2696565 RepID=UPI0014131CE8|nr:type II toxin-antitoxin system prevent-host-death family antitoxin [Kineococcus vitellinus]
MRTISAEDLRDQLARVLREVQEGETFTVTREGRPVATIGPHEPSQPGGPQTWVPAGQVIGALAHLDPGLAGRLRTDLDEHFDDDVSDLFERHRRTRSRQT